MENAQSKQGWRERFDEVVKKYVFGFCCGKCGGGGIYDGETCSDCGGHGIVDWQTTNLKSFIQTELDKAKAEERKRLMRVAEQNWTKSGERNLTDLDALRAAADSIDPPNQEKI